MSEKLEEFKEIKSVMDAMAPSMDQVLHKMNKLKQETNNTKSDFKSLDQNMKKILENFAKSFGKNIAGGFSQTDNFNKNGDFGLSSILPKMLSSLISGARATGGPVAANNSYLVGEKGPEIFTPNNAGNIIPNHNIGKSPVNIVMNITTPNADSFRKNQNQILVDAMGAMSRAGRNI
jgi:phage-related minor tail protein